VPGRLGGRLVPRGARRRRADDVRPGCGAAGDHRVPVVSGGGRLPGVRVGGEREGRRVGRDAQPRAAESAAAAAAGGAAGAPGGLAAQPVDAFGDGPHRGHGEDGERGVHGEVQEQHGGLRGRVLRYSGKYSTPALSCQESPGDSSRQ
jgi:hypothetical protein